MRSSRYSDNQNLAVLKQNDQGVSVPDLCRGHGMSSAQFYIWRPSSAAMDVSMMKGLEELESENKRLKKMFVKGHCHVDRWCGMVQR